MLPPTPPADAVHADRAHVNPTEETPVRPPPPLRTAARRPPPPRRRTTTTKPELKTPRLTVVTDDDGLIDFDRVTPDNFEKFKAAVTHPEAMRRLGLVNDAGAPTPPRTWANMTEVLIDAVNSIAVQAAKNNWKLTDDQAKFLFLKNAPPPEVPGQPTVYQQTTQLTGELLDKHFPGGFGEYDKEISLLVLLGGFTTTAVQKIRATTPGGVVDFPRAAAQQE